MIQNVFNVIAAFNIIGWCEAAWCLLLSERGRKRGKEESERKGGAWLFAPLMNFVKWKIEKSYWINEPWCDGWLSQLSNNAWFLYSDYGNEKFLCARWPFMWKINPTKWTMMMKGGLVFLFYYSKWGRAFHTFEFCFWFSSLLIYIIFQTLKLNFYFKMWKEDANVEYTKVRWRSKYETNEPVASYWELRGCQKCEWSELKKIEGAAFRTSPWTARMVCPPLNTTYIGFTTLIDFILTEVSERDFFLESKSAKIFNISEILENHEFCPHYYRRLYRIRVEYIRFWCYSLCFIYSTFIYTQIALQQKYSTQ